MLLWKFQWYWLVGCNAICLLCKNVAKKIIRPTLLPCDEVYSPSPQRRDLRNLQMGSLLKMDCKPKYMILYALYTGNLNILPHKMATEY